ncbi:protein of unknown function [Moritella yayanosii]|uniref:Uncharacterized protein n=1 Tax=Moritella yayanosii TaxID=69539 RepID=A0A330LSI3_9GAMM|nr:protein of unknown function [Moritella yayanosii]
MRKGSLTYFEFVLANTTQKTPVKLTSTGYELTLSDKESDTIQYLKQPDSIKLSGCKLQL